MSWQSKVQVAIGLSATNTEVFSDYIALNPGESAHVQIKADFPATPTDNLLVNIYGTLDESSEQSDNVGAESEVTISNTVDPSWKSIKVSGYRKFRLGFKASGATDTITVNAWVRTDGRHEWSTRP